MDIPGGQLDNIRHLISETLDACNSTAPAATEQSGAAELVQAFGQLVEVMQRLDADHAAADRAAGTDVTEIGEYALRLAEGLSAEIEQHQPGGLKMEQAALIIDIALWVAQRGGLIDTLEPVVDALARYANTIRDPDKLEALSGVIGQIIAAVSPVISQDLEKINPGRPWRVLLLNQSIIATRSHNTALMEQAFAQLTSKLPEDARQFFTEGIQQMDALDYPESVRKVMEKYHRQWSMDRSLH
ncbi:MAG: hypothetical protein OEU91_04690 [Gammaproteobacteria bacterium]|nr:hypothetical protein [Gammaproteobacteria bacterium]